MNNPKFQKWKSSKNFQFYFHLRASNGEVVLSSEGYITEQGCDSGILSVRQNAPIDAKYDRKDSYNNYTFNLKCGNGEIIGRSENYTTLQAREVGISSVKRDAPTAPVERI